MQSINDEHAVLEVAHIRQVAEDCYTIVSSEGPSFFVRSIYLHALCIDDICEGSLFRDEQAQSLIFAGFCCSAERYAVSLLNRSEQSRSGLTRKLLIKGFKAEMCCAALDYLEGNGVLSDKRYALAWAGYRVKAKGESRSKVINGLLARGIDKNTAEDAVREVFSAVDEETLLSNAEKKYRMRGFSGDKLCRKLVSLGFSLKSVKSIINKK